MAIWTKLLSKFEQFDQKHDQYLEFDFFVNSIFRKILNLKLVQNWLRCMLFVLTRPWHNFRTRNVRMCLRPVLAWCPLSDTKTVSQFPSDGQRRDMASDVKYVWWRHNQTDVTIIKTRQSSMVKGNWMSQLVRTFDRGMNPRRFRNSLTCFVFLQIWSPIPEDSGADTCQTWSLFGHNGTDTRQVFPSFRKVVVLTHVRPDPPTKKLCTRILRVQICLWLIFCVDIFTQKGRRDCLSEWKWSPSNLTRLSFCRGSIVGCGWDGHSFQIIWM